MKSTARNDRNEVSNTIQGLIGKYIEVVLTTPSSKISWHYKTAEVNMDWEARTFEIVRAEGEYTREGYPQPVLFFQGVEEIHPQEYGGLSLTGTSEESSWKVTMEIFAVIEQVDVLFTEDRRVIAKFLKSLPGKEVLVWKSRLPYSGENVTLQEFFVVKSARLSGRIFSITPRSKKAIHIQDIESAVVDQEMCNLILNGEEDDGLWEAQVVLQDREADFTTD